MGDIASVEEPADQRVGLAPVGATVHLRLQAVREIGASRRHDRHMRGIHCKKVKRGEKYPIIIMQEKYHHSLLMMMVVAMRL